jgi:hypothetical protein
MKRLKNIQIAWLFLLILRGMSLHGQTTVQVVTKTIDKAFDYKQGNLVSIDAEKADITIKTDANTKEVKVKIDLMSKHPQIDAAKKDIDALKVITEIIGKTIYLRNYVAIAKGEEKPKSELRARYTILLPPDAAVSVKNNFGKLNITDLKSKLSIVSEFCKTQLDNISGEVAIDAKFGDIMGNNINAKIAIVSHRTDIDLKILRGVCDIKAQYGKIKIDADRLLTTLKVQAEKADVKVTPPEGTVAYILDAEYGKVMTPKGSTLKYSERTKEREKITWSPQNAKTNIQIQTSFGTIEIGN